MTKQKHMQRQVEQIMDEIGSMSRPSVILRVGAGAASYRTPVSKGLAEALRGSALGLSARELIPAKRRRATRSSKQKRRTARGRAALSTKTQARALKKSRQSLLSNAMKCAPIRKARAAQRSGARRGSKKRTSGPRAFWSSQSIVMEIDREAIPDLPKEVPGISDIYLNRKLLPPSYVEAKRLPETITDNKSSAWGLQAINALAAWGAFEVRGSGARVAVLDTGVDATHPDLSGKVAAWAEFDASGNQVPGSKPHDTDEHGTHVAGTIAGGNASGEWIGVAPEAQIFAALVLDGAIGGTDAQVLAGIDWAISSGADVINMSLGGLTLGSDVPATYTQAIVNALLAGIPVVAAIGNEGSQTTGLPGNDLFAFAVGATDHRDRPAGFSGGRTQVITQSPFIDPADLPLPYSKPDVAAPGVGVKSSVPGGDWKFFNGTSMATPHVSGAIALLASGLDLSTEVGSDRAFFLQRLLAGTVEELGESGQDHRFGQGRVDILRALGEGKALGF